MRRGRSLRDFRNKMLRRRQLVNRKKNVENIVMTPPKRPRQSREEIMRVRRKHADERRRLRGDIDIRKCPAREPIELEFKSYDEYKYTSRPVRVLHLIESLGLGGAQTMMMELANGLNAYYPDHITNYVSSLHHKILKPDKKLFGSYGVDVTHLNHANLKVFCKEQKIDVAVHHRIVHSNCQRRHIYSKTKYVLLNHTWNSLRKVPAFPYCDFYVSVCKFLDKNTKWPDYIHKSRRVVILNGVENNFVENLPSYDFENEGFKIGRCHRLVPSKFQSDSIHWVNNTVSKVIPNISYYILGTSSTAKTLAGGRVHYLGPVLNRQKKMSMIKAWDVYFYETTQNEGASMAILESLACGVPVLCKPLGGNIELLKHKVNGFIVTDRSEFLSRLKQIASAPELLCEMKQNLRKDFDERLHVRHTACKYMQLFECLINET